MVLNPDGGCSDYVFFFSYAQPKQQGGVTGMWSDAEALVDVNSTSTPPLSSRNHAVD